MDLGGFTVQSLPLQGQIVLVVQDAQFASVAPLGSIPRVLKHLTVPAVVLGAASVVEIVVSGTVSDIVVDLVVSGIVSDIVEETCIVDETPAVVVVKAAQSNAWPTPQGQ